MAEMPGTSVAAVKSTLQWARATLRDAPVAGEPGDWRMTPTRANGQPAAAGWYGGEPSAVAVLTTGHGGITRITVFGFPDLAERFAGAPGEPNRHARVSA
ncbi:hypothetical protein [Amycolatopsis sp.]|uniref:hypothetical protein n=1 Tax=Amycolatopsis sp. TaxID=37632 RepID=UPI002D7E7ACB|nr:hypothetical protein [Amycolatopsis sp.]HET6705855.1 hypothetical protein [Amycolatopsis sp.]